MTPIDAAKGNAKMLYPPDLVIHGNSHMIMQDKNNLQIGDLILDWIDRNVGTKITSHPVALRLSCPCRPGRPPKDQGA